jgi:hypothetical protein
MLACTCLHFFACTGNFCSGLRGLSFIYIVPFFFFFFFFLPFFACDHSPTHPHPHPSPGACHQTCNTLVTKVLQPYVLDFLCSSRRSQIKTLCSLRTSRVRSVSPITHATTRPATILARMPTVGNTLSTTPLRRFSRNNCKKKKKNPSRLAHSHVSVVLPKALCMFIGEFACLLVFKAVLLSAKLRNKPPPMELGKQTWNPLIFLVPAICDCTATSAMYVGLTLTYASSFQVGIVFSLVKSTCVPSYLPIIECINGRCYVEV